MLRLAVLSIVSLAEDEKTDAPGLDFRAETIQVVRESSIGEIFGAYQKRMTVVLSEEDFKHVNEESSTEHKLLLECSNFLFDKHTVRDDRIGFFLVNTSEPTMIEDAENYLNCTTRPCYAIELDGEEGGETKAYTRPIEGFTGYAKGHGFLASCKQFVNEYLEAAKSGAATYFIPEIAEPTDDEISDHGDADIDDLELVSGEDEN